MDNTTIIVACALLMTGLVALYSGLIIMRQQATIERLTDKLMAKDYREYMSMQPREPDPEPEPKRKPLSWHDDPSLDDDDDVRG